MIEKRVHFLFKEWWSGAHSIFENRSERVSALIFLLMSESWAKLKKLMSVEQVGSFVSFLADQGQKSNLLFMLLYPNCPLTR